MTRPVPEWIGKTDTTAIPPRVKLRILDRQGGKCGMCPRKLGVAGEAIEYDHVLALINGGQHRENNLQALCLFCHRPKTAQDVAQKAKTASVRAKHYGAKNKPVRPLPGSRASDWKQKIGGAWVRRSEDG